MKPQWGKQTVELFDASGKSVLKGEVVEDTTNRDYDIQAEIVEPDLSNLKLLAHYLGGEQ